MTTIKDKKWVDRGLWLEDKDIKSIFQPDNVYTCVQMSFSLKQISKFIVVVVVVLLMPMVPAVTHIAPRPQSSRVFLSKLYCQRFYSE